MGTNPFSFKKEKKKENQAEKKIKRGVSHTTQTPPQIHLL